MSTSSAILSLQVSNLLAKTLYLRQQSLDF
jgi:hypothetical protein